jgi:hypothetical protein
MKLWDVYFWEDAFGTDPKPKMMTVEANNEDQAEYVAKAKYSGRGEFQCFDVVLQGQYSIVAYYAGYKG